MENTEKVENQEVNTPNQAVNTDKNEQEIVSPKKQEAKSQVETLQESNVDEFVMPDENNQGEEEKLAPWMKDRIAREKRKADRKQQEIEELQERLRGYETRGLNQPQAQQYQQSENNETDPEEVIRKIIRDEVTRSEQAKNRQSEAQKIQAVKSKIDRGFEKYPDFEIVYQHKSVNPVTVSYLAELNDPDEFTYNLVKFNSDKLEAIEKLSPAKQIIQLDNLYKSFSQKVKGKRFSNAPAPIDKVPSSAPVSDDWSSASFDQLRKMTKTKRR